MARLFFALWPDASAAERLELLARELVQSTGGKAVPRAKIHLTVAFLGEVTPEGAVAASAVAASLRAPAPDIALDRVGFFPGARIAWAGSGTPSGALMTLHAKLVQALREAGLGLEDRGFVPHVTLARRIVKASSGAAIQAIGWRADELALVRTEAGTGRYLTLEAWPLLPG